MEDKNKEQLAVFSQISEVIEKDSSMIIKNPVLGDVVFANGTLGNLEKKNTGGFGIKHIIDGRYRKDGLDEKEISALLYLIKDTVETVIPDDISKNRLNIRKNSIFVGVSKQWLGSDENWVITGFAENDENNAIKKEAADAIKAVNAQYGYAPEFLSISRQVGAVIASIDKITQINEKSTVNAKIKMPGQLIYASDEIGQVIERATGKQLVTVNPTRANGKAEPPRANITQNAEKSTSAEQSSESKVLYGKTTVNVDGLERECEHGVLDGFKNAVKMVDRLKYENSRLKKENIELHKRLEQKSHSKNHHEKEIER